eukprot:6317480-Prymnesium_polylepis.1
MPANPCRLRLFVVCDSANAWISRQSTNAHWSPLRSGSVRMRGIVSVPWCRKTPRAGARPA